MPQKIMVTGHRPQRLGGYTASNPTRDWVLEQLLDILYRTKGKHPDIEAISGMALGVDQWFAQCAMVEDIPYHAYVPFVGQESRWNKVSKDWYKTLLSRAKSTVIVSPGSYAAWKMHKRDKRMVKDANFHIAVWDGKNYGGTAATVGYIRERGKSFYHIDPVNRECGWKQ